METKKNVFTLLFKNSLIYLIVVNIKLFVIPKMKLAKSGEKNMRDFFFLSRSFFILFYSSNKMAHTHKKKKRNIFTVER
jgi:uncharacterized membrane protein